MDEKKKKSSSSNPMIFIAAAVIIVFLAGAVFMMSLLSSDDGKRKKREVAQVTLLKPPTPQEVKEKPPEEIVKKEEKVETIAQVENDRPQNNEQDDKAAGKDLGVDADGAAGGDGFGLVGRRGGRSLIAGGDGSAMMKKYGWYTSLIQEDIKKYVRRRLDENGGIPKGKLQTGIRITLDGRGTVVDYRITASSGNRSMDETVKEALSFIRMSEPPPEGMPKTVNLRISSQG
jgi:TonB family protein